MKKRILSLLMVLALCLSLLPVSVLADEPEDAPEDGLENTLPAEEPEEELPEEPETEFVLAELPTFTVSLEDEPFPSFSLFSVLGTSWTDTGKFTSGVYEGYYAQLDATSQDFYNKLKTAFSDPTTQAEITVDQTFDGLTGALNEEGKIALSDTSSAELNAWMRANLTIAYEALERDHPEMPWLRGSSYQWGTSSISFSTGPVDDGNGNYSFGLTVEKIIFQPIGVPSEISNGTETFNTAVNTAVAAVTAASTRYGTVKAIHDYLCDLLTYDYDKETSSPENQTAYSALVGKVTVCAGYGTSFKLLCDKFGIPCVYVSGTGGNEAHGWNYVQMDDGKWYAVDVTWDDQRTETYYDFFLVGSKTTAGSGWEEGIANTAFSQSHVPNGQWLTGCTMPYPELNDEAYKIPITSLAVSGLTAPVKGGTPATSVTVSGVSAADGASPSIGASVVWDPNDSPFAPSTAYTAELTLTAPAGYQFIKGTTNVTVSGVTGATESVSNNGTTLTITVPFGATEGAELTGLTVARTDDGGDVAVPEKGEETTVNLTATAAYDNGASTQDVTATAGWSVTATGDVSTTGVTVSNGIVTITPAASAGTFTITATYEVESVTKTASITLNLTKDGANVPTSLTVSGTKSITSGTTETTAEYTVTGENKYGETIPTLSNLTWSVDPTTDGLSINNGTLNIPAGYVGNVTVKATSGSVSGELSVSITRADSVLTSVTLDKTEVTISGYNDDAETQTVKATAYDQYGTDITSSMNQWMVGNTKGSSLRSVTTLDPNVHIDMSGTITVGNAAPAGTWTVTATRGSETATATLTIKRMDSTANGVSVASDVSEIEIPVGENTATAKFTATVTDQYEDEIESAVTWRLTEAVDGVTINEDGVVTVTADAAKTISDTDGRTFTVTATVGGVTSEGKTITVKRAASVATTVTVSGDTSIDVPASDVEENTSNTFTAKVYDQYGTEMTGAAVEWWSIDPDIYGVSISNGVVAVGNAAKADITDATGKALTVTATVGDVSGTAQITVKRAASVLTSVTPAEMKVYVSAGADQTVQFKALDQYDAEITSGVKWTITQNSRALNREVTINADTGVVTVGNAAPKSAWTVTAAYGEETAATTLTISREDSTPGSVAVSGGVGTMEIPASGSTTATAAFTAAVKDQYEESMDDAEITWTITDSEGNEVDGVTIDDNGYVTVTADAAKTIFDTDGKTFTVTASSRSASGEAQISVKRADPVLTSLELWRGGSKVGSADTLIIPASASTAYTYTVKGLDQYGADMTVTGPTWTFTTADGKVTHTNGTVTVAAGAEKDKAYTLTAESGDVSVSTTITVKDIDITWPTATVKENPTYGDTWAEIVTLTGGSASINGTAVPGKFTLTTTGTPDAGSQTYVVNFKSDNGQYDVDKTYEAVTIAPKSVSVTWSNTALTYDGTAQAPTATVTTGLVGGDTLPVTVAGQQTSAGTYTATASIVSTNYTLASNTASATFTIAKKPLTIASDSLSITKVYDGTTALGTVNGTLSPKGVVEGDTVSVAYAGSAYADKNAGTGKSVTLAVTLDGASKDNYTLESSTYTFTGAEITKRPVTVSGITAVNKVYDGTTAATLTLAQTIDGMITGDILSAVATGAFTDKNAGIAKTVNITNITLIGTDAGNYTLADSGSQTTATVNVARRVLTLGDGDVAVTKVYDGTTDAGTLTGTLALTGAVAGDTVSVDMSKVTVGAYDSAGYGTNHTVTLSNIALTGADKDNYQVAATYAFTKAAITKAPQAALGITAPENKAYGDAAFDITVTGGSGSGAVTLTSSDPSVLSLTKKDETTFTATIHKAGNVTLTANKTGDTNYEPAAAATHSFTIAKADRDLTVTPATLVLVPNALTGTIAANYADLDGSGNVAYSLSGDTTAVSYKSASGTITAVGNGKVTVTITVEATTNYNAASATVTVTALAEPVTGITSVTSSTAGDTLTGAFQDGKVVVSGTLTEGATLTTVTPELANVDGLTGLTATNDGTSLTVKLDGSEIASYPIDISAVVKKAANVTIEDGGKSTGNEVTDDKADAANTAITDKDTKVEDLTASAAKALQETAQQLESSKQEEITATEYTIKVEVSVDITAKALTDTSFKIEVTPTYTVTAVDSSNESNTVVLAEKKTLPNSYLTTPATVSVKLPAGFGTENLFAKHYLSSGRTENLRVTVTGGVATWQQSSFSEVELFSDARSGSVTYTFEDGTTRTVTYDAADIGTALPTDTKSGYTFNGWNINGKDYTTLTEELLTALNGDSGKTAAATFTQTAAPSHSGGSSSGSVTTYPVTVDSGKHGAVTTSAKNASKGTTVTITVKPDDGYQLDTLRVTDKNGDRVKVTEGKNGKFTFTMPASKVTVEASFTEAEETEADWPFTDVADDFWARDAIAWVYENGYMNGVSATVFNPNGSVTRQQLWMILARLSGHRPADMAEARAWAMDNGISDGTNPGNAVSRQQMVTILYRYAAMMGYKTSGGADLGTFPDSAKVAAYAKDAMSWSVGNGIIGGTAQGTLNPAGTATRAQFATILQRFYQNIVG